jgi:hypothetical protein
MRHLGLLTSILVSCTIVTFLPSPAGAQTTGQTSGFPIISGRTYTSGSAQVTVSGADKIDQQIPLNAQASISDGEVTWLQFGVSGSAEPNALITYGETREIGISVGKGKFIVTGGIIPGEKSECSGKAKVTATAIVGEYTCVGLTSHDPAVGMKKVDVKVGFTAK